MNFLRNAVSVGLLVLMLGAVVPGTNGLVPQAKPAFSLPAAMPARLAELEQQAGTEPIDVDFLVTTEADQHRLTEAIKGAGGEVVLQEKTYVRGRVSTAAVTQLAQTKGVGGVGVNGQLQVAPTQIAAAGQPLDRETARATISQNLTPMGFQDYKAEYNATGSGIVVAVIDSGIDPGHPDLQQTQDGRPKVVDWKDFTDEGYVGFSQSVPAGAEFAASDGRRFQLPADVAAGARARFGYWEERFVDGYINRDLDRNGLKIDKFGVLVVRSQASGIFDRVYVDTNNDGSFRDEKPLGLYRNTHDYGSLGIYRAQPLSQRRLNFVVAELHPEGNYVRLGFDGLGHGTWVSGVLAASSRDGMNGVAPGAQLMVIKALKSSNSGDWLKAIKPAIEYAAVNGASIINLSVGGLSSAAKEFDTGASEWLNLIARQYGVLIVLAADNTGPGLSSGTTLGSASTVMAVGSYFSAQMWLRDYNWVVPHESIWFFSGMGPRSDGNYLPSVVAPGGSPTTSPMWRDNTGYRTAVGTSIATPHVSGAAALLMESARKTGMASDWLSVKRALEMGARRIPGFDVYEQGNGLINLLPAQNHLQQIKPFAGIKVTNRDGAEGLLARSYFPASAAFSLTNMGSELSRVSIFSSEPWLKSAFTSLTLPAGVTRQLPLQLSPPAESKVHSAFLTITHQNTYGPSLVLPITHVGAVNLGPTNDYTYKASENLEAGRYRRYFVKVPAGAASLSVTSRVPLTEPGLGRGTVQVHVFRPDGQAVHTGRIGVAADGLTSLFQTNDPVEGVWEVVIVALPDPLLDNANPGFTVDVRARPGAISAQPIRLAVPAGSTTVQQVRVSNPYAEFTGQVDAVGLVKPDMRDPWNLSVPWSVRQTPPNLFDDFTLREFVSEFRYEIANPVRSGSNDPLPPEVDLSLSLYRRNPNGGLDLVAQSVTPGSNTEVIQRSNLSAGSYIVSVTTNTDVPLKLQYRRLIGSDQFDIKVQDEPRRHVSGDVWTVNYTVRAPNTPGRYYGHILLRDTVQKEVIAWYPIEVSVGQPEIAVRSLLSPLTTNRPSTVTLELRERQTGRPLPDLPLTVNGQRFLSRNGQITVPVTPRGATEVLNVEADLPGYQFLKERITLPVKDAWGSYPLGIDKNEENLSWRRKVINQLP